MSLPDLSSLPQSSHATAFCTTLWTSWGRRGSPGGCPCSDCRASPGLPPSTNRLSTSKPSPPSGEHHVNTVLGRENGGYVTSRAWLASFPGFPVPYVLRNVSEQSEREESLLFILQATKAWWRPGNEAISRPGHGLLVSYIHSYWIS